MAEQVPVLKSRSVRSENSGLKIKGVSQHPHRRDGQESVLGEQFQPNPLREDHAPQWS